MTVILPEVGDGVLTRGPLKKRRGMDGESHGRAICSLRYSPASPFPPMHLLYVPGEGFSTALFLPARSMCRTPPVHPYMTVFMRAA
jgi:hypothetical protein